MKVKTHLIIGQWAEDHLRQTSGKQVVATQPNPNTHSQVGAAAPGSVKIGVPMRAI
jgi:hypothetical protein